MKYARIEAGQIVEVIDFDPAGKFIGLVWVEAPDDVTQAWSYEDGEFSSPPPPEPATPIDEPSLLPEPAPTYLKQISPVAFKMQFEVLEALAIEDAIAYDGADADLIAVKRFVKHWWGIVEDPRLTTVDLTLSTTQGAVGFLVTAGILTEARKDQILEGVPV